MAKTHVWYRDEFKYMNLSKVWISRVLVESACNMSELGRINAWVDYSLCYGSKRGCEFETSLAVEFWLQQSSIVTAYNLGSSHLSIQEIDLHRCWAIRLWQTFLSRGFGSKVQEQVRGVATETTSLKEWGTEVTVPHGWLLQAAGKRDQIRVRRIFPALWEKQCLTPTDANSRISPSSFPLDVEPVHYHLSDKTHPRLLRMELN